MYSQGLYFRGRGSLPEEVILQLLLRIEVVGEDSEELKLLELLEHRVKGRIVKEGLREGKGRALQE